MLKRLAYTLGIVVIIAVGFVLYGLFAPLKVHYSTAIAPVAVGYPAAQVDTQPFVGLALSGGGARAAVFAAAGMRAMNAHGLLDQVTHVSSVSGGGFTAAYWALTPMPAGQSDAYFQAMQKTVAHNYQWDIHVNQAMSPSRLLSPSRRLLSLQDALEGQTYFTTSDGRSATIADLPDARAFYFNAVSYDTGRRFVISNHALPAPGDGDASGLPDAIRALSFSQPGLLRPAPADFPVSLAVATSAAFPPYIGPTTLQVDADGVQFWHLGDGGLLENTGIETLREAIYARTDARPAMIFSFDGGKRLEQDFTKADISVFSRDIVQLVDVILTYASGHRETLYDALDDAAGKDITLVRFDYLSLRDIFRDAPLSADAATWGSWDKWPQISAADRAGSASPVARLADIPTGYSITAGDEVLIAAAAKFLVDRWVTLHPQVPKY